MGSPDQRKNMVTVIKLERQGKGRYEASFDNGIKTGLYRSEAAQLGIEEGTVLSEDQYQFLLKEVIGKRAKKRALHLLEQMDRTEMQLMEKLRAGGYPECCVEEAVSYVKKYHYLDDFRYACTYIRTHQEKLGRQQLQQKLAGKGIRRDLAERALETEYVSEDSAKIRELLVKRRFDPETSDEKEFSRTYAFLMRRGFSGNEVLREMKNYRESSSCR